jgi:DNA-binding NtrC family response regulator
MAEGPKNKGEGGAANGAAEPNEWEIMAQEAAKEAAKANGQNPDEITEDDFDQSLPPKSALTDNGNDEFDLSKGIDLKSVIDKETIRLQKKYVTKALSITGGNKTQAAELLGITYQTIDNWKKGWEENDEK